MTQPHSDRRAFLRASAAFAGGAFALPGWLRAAVRGAAEQDPDAVQTLARDRQDALRKACREAARLRRPVLVVMVPTDPQQLWVHPSWIGAALNHGGDELLLDLARCELVCAAEADLLAVFGQLRGDVAAGAPFVALDVEAHEDGPRLRRLRQLPVDLTGLDEAAVQRTTDEESYAVWQKRQRDYSSDRVARYAKAMRGVLRDTRLELQAAAERAEFTPALRDTFDEFVVGAEGVEPSPQLGRMAAAMLCVAARAADDDAGRVRLLAPVLAGARQAWVESPVPGSRWARSTGCGVAIEGGRDDSMKIACGMGRVAPLTERFLYLHAR